MKKTFLLLFLSIFINKCINAQSLGRTYKTALGVKVWNGGGISFKTFPVTNKAVELIGFFDKYGTRITGLYEIHGNIEGAAGLKWYVGPGAHVGLYNYKGYYGDKAVAGIDGVIGLDYKINTTPFNISIDWQPSFEFADERGFAGSWGGFGVRYTF